jgi:glutathione S-transferase
MKIVGSYVSPYVRKVLACLWLKGLAGGYEIDPITPFFGGEEFERLSPLRRIPVLIDGDTALCDSSVICAYLDEAWPEPPLLPADPRHRARARWLEEYADTRLGDVFIWGLFYQKFVRPAVFGEKGDEARIEAILADDLPRELDYLEGQLPADGFLFGEDRARRHLDRHLLPQRRLCRLRSPIRSAGRAPPPSSPGRSPIPASPSPSRSSRRRSRPIRRAGARLCSTPEHRSARRRWGRGSPGRA